jgi:Domain of unknown function (DUF2804), C-terminal/Domain of unknown function (DUF2804), N-terminal
MKFNRNIILAWLACTLLPTIGCRQLVPTPQPLREVREQHRIAERGELLDHRGWLATKGWAPSALLIYDPVRVAEGEQNLREWEFFTVLTEDYALNFTIAKVRFAAFCAVDFIDFESGETKMGFVYETGVDDLIEMTPDNFGKTVCREDGREVVVFERSGDQRVLTYDLPETLLAHSMKGEITLGQKRDMDFLALATPFTEDERMFFYEQKISGMPASGTAVVDGTVFELPPGQAFAVMDWGRGVWPDKLNWRWGSASGIVDDKVISFNIGNGFGEMSAASENLIVYDGTAHKIDQVIWHYDSADYSKPWHFTSNDGRFEMTLDPVFDQNMDFNAIFKYGTLHKVYGNFSGFIILDDGRKIEIENMMGFAEEVFISW